MNNLLTSARIKRLDNQLANQIAAGEVVERPASVVKELMENSIDAGATSIEVEIERGGARLIRVTDNGSGIEKEDLVLALSRHATSKITDAKDLAAIQSLGFRGEALASISSVSRLCLTSRTQQSDLAWQAMAEGREMQVQVQPAAAMPGTSIQVNDLFYNTPARQNFLRAEKTEFNHIENVFKQLALSHFDIALNLKHKGKIVKRFAACDRQKNPLKRLKDICGKAFVDHCIAVECSHEAAQINGWLGSADFHRSESDMQYVFVNQRAVKDRTLNHAIRQAYSDLLPAGRMSAYVIFLSINPSLVDVNVHPTKHEVRFSQQRLIHDLLAKNIRDTLKDYQISNNYQKSTHQKSNHQKNNLQDNYQISDADNNKFALSANATSKKTFNTNFSSDTKPRAIPISRSQVQQVNSRLIAETNKFYQHAPSSSPLIENTTASQTNLIYVADNLWITRIKQTTLVFNALELFKEFLNLLMQQKVSINSKQLLFPQTLSAGEDFMEDYDYQQKIKKLGFEFQTSGQQNISLTAVPQWVVNYNTNWICVKLTDCLANVADNQTALVANIISWFSELEEQLVAEIYDALGEKLLQLNSHRKINPQMLLALFK